MDYKKLGSRIREVRISRGITQEKVAEMCSISPTFTSEIEHGKKLSIETLVKISSALNIGTDYILIDSIRNTSEENIEHIISIIRKLTSSEVGLAIDILNSISSYVDKKKST